MHTCMLFSVHAASLLSVLMVQKICSFALINHYMLHFTPFKCLHGTAPPIPRWRVLPVFGPQSSRSSSLSVIITDRP